MTSKNRDKNVWFIPKRSNIHQMVALLHGIIKRNYNGTVWNTAKQDNLNLELKNLGATLSGRKIAPQGMRTLLASVHYLGFLYLDNTTTPSVLRVTKAGFDFYNEHKDKLVKMEKLEEKESILYSNSVLHQLTKLQITNPIIYSYCVDIYVFPFRVTLIMLMKLGYLDIEEIAMFVFHTRNMSEIDYVIDQILNFRKMKASDRIRQVTLYKETIIGNLTLKQAPSAGYFMSFCVGSGVIERLSMLTNSDKKVSAITIKSDKMDQVTNLINVHKNTEIFDFENNLKLWVDYYGVPERIYPPVLMSIINETDVEFYIEIFDNSTNLIETLIINGNNELSVPLFHNENYEIRLHTISGGNLIHSENIHISNSIKYVIKNTLIKEIIDNDENLFSSYTTLSVQELISEIKEHSASSTFSNKMKIKLHLLLNKLNINKLNDKSLRGAVYEYLYYLLLNRLVKVGIVDEVIWNGKVGNYNLPSQSPGGLKGIPDLVFIVNDVRYVLELTTIKSKSAQFNAEGSSVPDHIILYSRDHQYAEVRGIFSAPLINDRVHSTMSAVVSKENIPFVSISEDDLLKILESKNKKDLQEKLNNLYK